ncbi:MAG: hypothetical protein RL456_1688 [Pseudomonadota bacterium]|jgi:hypothetical protein
MPPKPNYAFEKRQREQEKKKKKAEKAQRKAAAPDEAPLTQPPAGEDAPAAPAPATGG